VGPFGDFGWEEEVLYNLLPEADILADADYDYTLRRVQSTAASTLQLARYTIRDWDQLRDPLEVRTRYDRRGYVRLGPVRDSLGDAAQQGLDGSALSVGAFTATSARFQATDRDSVLRVSRSAVPANNRDFRIISIVDPRTVITEPLISVDVGVLRWSMHARESSASGCLTLEIFQGDVSGIVPGDILTDGEGVYSVTARRRSYNALPGQPLVERGYVNAALQASGTVLVPNGIFDITDVGKRLQVVGSTLEQDGTYEIQRVLSVGEVELINSNGVVPTFTVEEDLEVVLIPRPQLDIEGTLAPKGVAEQGGVDLEVVGIGTVTSATGQFTSNDVGSVIQVFGSLVGNDGLYEILTIVDDRTVTVDGSLSSETGGGWWVRKSTSAVDGGDGSQVEVYAESILKEVSQDYGIEVDTQESEARQRSWVYNASRWMDVKGTERSYQIIGLASGFQVEVYPLYALSLERYLNMPSDALFPAGDTGDGRYGTDGELLLAADLTGAIRAASALFKAGDAGNAFVSITGAATPANNGLFAVESVSSATLAILSRLTPVAATDANNGALIWSVVRLYTSHAPSLPLFDEVNSDRMTTIIEAEPGGNTFRVDKYCWEDDWSSDVPVTCTAVSPITAVRFLLEVEDNTTLGDARSPEVAQVVGNWLFIDADGEEHVLETVPSGGPPAYIFEVCAETAPALGDGVLRLECTTQVTCGYCPASAVGLIITYGTVASEAGLAIERATERLIRRFEEVRPIHVRLVPRITTEICCYYSVQGIIDTGASVSEILAPYNALYDEIPADDIPADTYLIRVLIDTP